MAEGLERVLYLLHVPGKRAESLGRLPALHLEHAQHRLDSLVLAQVLVRRLEPEAAHAGEVVAPIEDAHLEQPVARVPVLPRDEEQLALVVARLPQRLSLEEAAAPLRVHLEENARAAKGKHVRVLRDHKVNQTAPSQESYLRVRLVRCDHVPHARKAQRVDELVRVLGRDVDRTVELDERLVAKPCRQQRVGRGNVTRTLVAPFLLSCRLGWQSGAI